jgi:hypothetical protein
MKWRMTKLVAALLTVALAGCNGELTPAASENGELELLVQRAVDLKASVQGAGRMTPALRAQLTALSSDIEKWQERTGRTDIAVSHSKPANEQTKPANEQIAAARVGVAPGTPGCEPCPLIDASGGRVCFLVEESDCRDGIITKVCAYVCLTTPSRR